MTPYSYVCSADGLHAICAALSRSDRAAIDVETTGLNPRREHLRLLTVAVADHAWVIDVDRVDPALVIEALAHPRLIGHNIAFDLRFLAAHGLEAGSVEDTMLLDYLLHSGEEGIRHSLSELARRELGLEISKELQTSDWSGELSPQQVEYAATDAAILLPLQSSLAAKIQEAGLEAAASIENRCLPAMVWMAGVGAPFDADRWRSLAAEAEKDGERIRAEMDRIAPRRGVLDLGFGWNWDSPQEVREALLEAGIQVQNTNDETLSEIAHPLAAALRRYRENRKLATTYGLNWLKHVDGKRVYPDWRQLGASSGRMACSSPNLQQIPRDPRYRACIAAPEGHVLVKADYSQIELRIAACIAGEERMIQAYETGQDLHALTARRVLGKAEITRDDRQLAKAINFGLLYGMGAEGFRRYAGSQYGVDLTEKEAARYRAAFFAAYPGLRRWHQSVRNNPATETRTLGGRRHRVDAETPLPLRLNLPVQGTGADGLKRALALLWERRHQQPEAVPVIACHDEIVVECREASAESVRSWLLKAMMDGMAPLVHPAPVEVEVRVGKTWAG